MAISITITIDGDDVRVVLPDADIVPPPPRPETALPKLGYKVHEAAEIAGIFESNLRVHIQNGELRARKNGYHYLILHDELDAFLHTRPVHNAGAET